MKVLASTLMNPRACWAVYNAQRVHPPGEHPIRCMHGSDCIPLVVRMATLAPSSMGKVTLHPAIISCGVACRAASPHGANGGLPWHPRPRRAGLLQAVECLSPTCKDAALGRC